MGELISDMKIGADGYPESQKSKMTYGPRRRASERYDSERTGVGPDPRMPKGSDEGSRGFKIS
jgi:hypothetical protein